MTICAFVNLSIYPFFTFLPAYVSIFSFVHLSTCLFVHTFIIFHLSICPLVYLSICPFVHLPSYSFVYLSIYLFFHLSFVMKLLIFSALKFFYFSICLSVCLSIYPHVLRLLIFLTYSLVSTQFFCLIHIFSWFVIFNTIEITLVYFSLSETT
jgi:hypothetical protein